MGRGVLKISGSVMRAASSCLYGMGTGSLGEREAPSPPAIEEGWGMNSGASTLQVESAGKSEVVYSGTRPTVRWPFFTTAFSPTWIPATSATSTVSTWPLKSLRVTVFPLTAVTVQGGAMTL